MARPRLELPPAEAIRALADGEGRLRLRVTPGARTGGMDLAAEHLLVKIRAKPMDGEANEAVLALLAQALGTARSGLHLVRGAIGRDKVVQLPPV